MAITVIAIAAVAAAGASVYSAMNAPEPPQMPSPPPPSANNVTNTIGGTRQVYKEGTGWVIEEIPDAELSPEQLAEKKAKKAEDAQLKELRATAIGNISKTPEDRVKAYDNFAKTFSAQLHRDVDERYDERVKTDLENLEATGMTGSAAYSARLAQRRIEKGKLDTDIAQKATLASEDLAKSDRDYWTNLVGMIDSGARADAALAYQSAGLSNQIAQQGRANDLASYYANTNNILNTWNAKLDRNKAITTSAAGLAGTLGAGYLYGQGKSPLTPKTTGTATDRWINPTNYAGNYSLWR